MKTLTLWDLKKCNKIGIDSTVLRMFTDNTLINSELSQQSFM